MSAVEDMLAALVREWSVDIRKQGDLYIVTLNAYRVGRTYRGKDLSRCIAAAYLGHRPGLVE